MATDSTDSTDQCLTVYGRRVLHHGGAIEGGRAMLMMFPESKVVVAMLANVLVDFGEKDAQQIAHLFIR